MRGISKNENPIKILIRKSVLKYSDRQDQEFSICLSVDYENCKYIETKCKHHFHEVCLNKYLLLKKLNEIKCPVCNEQLNTKNNFIDEAIELNLV